MLVNKNRFIKGEIQLLKKDSIFNRGLITSFKEETLQIGDNTISYLVRKGDTAEKTYVLVHGATALKNTFNMFAAELAERQPNSTIISVDLPLHGKSTNTEVDVESITVQTYTDVMEEFLKLKTDDGTITGKLNYVGWSMGGSIGMLLELRGIKLDELTLLNSSPYWEFTDALLPMVNVENIKEVFASLGAEDFNQNITDVDKEDILTNIENMVTERADVMIQDFIAISPKNYDIKSELKDIKAKTLILAGTKDTVSLIHYNELMSYEIKDSKLIIYDDSHTQLMKPIQIKKIVSEMENFFN